MATQMLALPLLPNSGEKHRKRLGDRYPGDYDEAGMKPLRGLSLGETFFLFCLCIFVFFSLGVSTPLSLDGVLYAAISRRIAETGEWLYLYGGVKEFDPFAEHPHGIFWFTALFMQLLGASDFSARLPSHLLLFAFFLSYYAFIKREHGSLTAFVAAITLASMSYFTRWFHTPSPDAGLLLFGFLAVWAAHRGNFAYSGTLLGLSALFKGMGVFGFLPVIGLCLLSKKNFWKPALGFGATLLGVLGLYFLIIKLSSVPAFLDLYWYRQFTNRFGTSSGYQNLLSFDFWSRLTKDSHYLLWALPVSIFLYRKRLSTLFLPMSLFLPFTLVYAAKLRFGDHIWLTVLPWISWVFALVLHKLLPFQWKQFLMSQGARARFALGCLLLLSALSMPLLGKTGEREEWTSLLKAQSLAPEKKLDSALFDSATLPRNFLLLSVWSWKARLDSDYCYPSDCDVPLAKNGLLYVLHGKRENREDELLKQGWCETHPWSTQDDMAIYLRCESP